MDLTRDAFFAIETDAPEALEIPGKGTIYIRTMTAGERDEYERAASADRYKNARALIIQLCACDVQGKKLFGTSDLDLISGMPTVITEPVFDASLRVNKLRQKDIEAAAGE